MIADGRWPSELQRAAKPHWGADETLGSLCRELERREDLRNVGVDISGFPIIVAVIDEYSDLVNFGSGEMVLYDNGIISNCKLCRVIH